MEFTEEFIAGFEKNGFAFFDLFISLEESRGVLNELVAIRAQELFKKAGIGKESGFQVDDSQRGDFIHWIDPLHAGAFTAKFLIQLEELVILLNRNFYLGIRGVECHYTQYPVGTFYRKHVDRHKSGSLRIVSFVLYLNEDWNEEDGGQLRIWNTEGETTNILPQMGRLAVFLSELEHEVLTTHRVRNSITGWMRTTEL